MHNGNGNGNGHGNGKRLLLIGLAVLALFWIVNDAYDDGFRDAMLQTGQGATIRRFHGGPDFPWGLIILGGIGYVAWRKGAFDRFGGPGGPFDGGRGIQRYGGGGYVNGQGPAPTPSAAQGQGSGSGFRGPRAFFDDWHRQAHQAHQAQYTAPAPQAPPPYSHSGNGSPAAGGTHTPPPPPPAPDYWASMARPSGAAEGVAGSGAVSPPPAAEARPGESADGPRDAAGSTPERW